jgi:hypothetical protein|nr:MAG TPA: hypothetical protein [Caudoviricetes sp.]
MNAQEFLNVLNCLNEILDLHEYKVLVFYSGNESNNGFCVNTSEKTIEITVVEEE